MKQILRYFALPVSMGAPIGCNVPDLSRDRGWGMVRGVHIVVDAVPARRVCELQCADNFMRR